MSRTAKGESEAHLLGRYCRQRTATGDRAPEARPCVAFQSTFPDAYEDVNSDCNPHVRQKRTLPALVDLDDPKPLLIQKNHLAFLPNQKLTVSSCLIWRSPCIGVAPW